MEDGSVFIVIEGKLDVVLAKNENKMQVKTKLHSFHVKNPKKKIIFDFNERNTI
jgi:hypothetical protein